MCIVDIFTKSNSSTPTKYFFFSFSFNMLSILGISGQLGEMFF